LLGRNDDRGVCLHYMGMSDVLWRFDAKQLDDLIQEERNWDG